MVAYCWRAIFISLLFFLSGCEQESRFDNETVVDVCSIVVEAELTRIFGPFLVESPKTRTPIQATGNAGSCQWFFNNGKVSLVVKLATKASNDGLQDLDNRFFGEPNLGEIRASSGAIPWGMKDLGDKAYLLQSLTPDNSQIIMKMGGTYAWLRLRGASSVQLYSFARILSRELEVKKQN